jgi:hypothetical protein
MDQLKNTDNYLSTIIGSMINKILQIKDEPWVSEKAKNWLNLFLKPNMTVFEYGSGGSTLFLARRVKKVISVEYQLLWFLGVLFALLRRGIINFKLHLSKSEKGKNLKKKYMSSDKNIKTLSFKKFVTTIHQYPNHYFDLVFIDGRARNQCIDHAIPKIKKGGYILLDDSNRDSYQTGRNYLKKYKEINLDTATAWKIL